MKNEALKLADELNQIDEVEYSDLMVIEKCIAMIRRLVEELDKQKEKAKWFEESNKMFKETRDSLAMAVMLDQTSHDTKQKPLSDEEILHIYNESYRNTLMGIDPLVFAREIEERHGIK